MESEVVPSPEEQEASPAPDAPEPEEKPKRKPRSPAESKPKAALPTTEAGGKVADGLRRKLNEMVNSAALTEANRRRATAVDATDYEAGFDRIAGPSKRETAVVVVADVAGAIGAGLIGYAINVYTGTTGKSAGHLALIGGATLAVVSIILKYVKSGR